MDIQEIMDTIPLAFWKSLAFQQIAKREDLELPKWSILVNDTGVQVKKSSSLIFTITQHAHISPYAPARGCLLTFATVK